MRAGGNGGTVSSGTRSRVAAGGSSSTEGLYGVLVVVCCLVLVVAGFVAAVRMEAAWFSDRPVTTVPAPRADAVPREALQEAGTA